MERDIRVMMAFAAKDFIYDEVSLLSNVFDVLMPI